MQVRSAIGRGRCRRRRRHLPTRCAGPERRQIVTRSRTPLTIISGRLSRPLAATAVLALLIATGACSENRPFERESAAAQAKLAVPSSLTPPISGQDVAGAPEEWKLAERVAEALRSRDIPASAATRSRSAYVLKGQLRQGVERNGRSRVEVAW